MKAAARRITGTHVYGYVKCPRAVALDLHLDRALRRPTTEWEEFVRRRGRDFEASYVAALDYAEPAYPERDFDAGAAATLGLLREGAPCVFQGVLLDGDCLGIPDLLRRCPGESALGDHHYEVVDVKSSGRPRGDQILQVAFYSRLLTALQAREPEHGALVLKDGREERFRLRDYAPALAEVEHQLFRLRADPDSERPIFSPACEGCHWNHRCVPEMEEADDLSLVQGMTRGVRTLLEEAGCRTASTLAALDRSVGRHRLDAALVRRLRLAATAREQGQPLRQRRARVDLDPATVVHFLTDPFHGRVLFMGALHPATPDGQFSWACPRDHDHEWESFQSLVGALPDEARILHYGRVLPRWYDEAAFARQAGLGMESRFVDLQRRILGAALFPGPVFGLADCVRRGLGVDPHRHGHAGAAALWLEQDSAVDRIVNKGGADLRDLAALKERLLSTEDEGGPQS